MGPPNGDARLEHWKTVAKASGVKLTHQRIEILRELAVATDHPDAERVFLAVRERVPTVSLDTVYRTMWRLHDLGLITTLGPRSGTIRFDVNLERHHHFVCVRCGMIRDFHSDELDRVRVPEAVDSFGDVLDAHFEVRGICAPCQSSTPANTAPPHPTRTQP